MADKTGIEWTNSTWNPVVGCSVISPGCTNCYAMKLAGRLERMGSAIYRGHTQQTKAGAVWNGKVEASNWGQVIKPLSWKKPRRVFVNSMSDLFHEALPDATIDIVFAVMAVTSRHTYQVLTKRADRMQAYVTALGRDFDRLERAARDIGYTLKFEGRSLVSWPLQNIWLGVSVEDQQRADERIPELLQTPAAIRFLSCEPLLGRLDLRQHLVGHEEHGIDFSRAPGSVVGGCTGWTPPVDWVICGGESGRQARPMHPGWARSLRDQCRSAEVPFFFKQWGEWLPGAQYTAELQARDSNEVFSRYDMARWAGDEWDLNADPLEHSSEEEIYRVGKRNAGRIIDGRTHDEFPDDRVPA